ncbi:MAG TPA: RagB/SusD family nutrient uptake outer membrane protein [Kofleriaceae bacterium]|nr:RagB/SusD family nutrient uptake outer membrane protein [Kofleriaceae bacterium]
MRLKLQGIAALAAALSVSATACELDVEDLNNPGLDELEKNPTRVTVGAACTGLVIGNRRNRAQANGYIAQLGILGREAYNFDVADPRFIGELLEGPLQPGSPFGGNFWGAPYANIRLANIVQRVAAQVADYSEAEVSAIIGFSKTIEALDLLEVAVTRDTNGGVIDTDRAIEDPLGPIVGRDEMLREVGKLLDEGSTDLARAGEGSFPFELSKGYAGFDAPESFVTFNRAVRARVAVYLKDYPAALTALAGSFLSDTGVTLETLQRGVSNSYSTSPGDQVNNLINPNIFAHPSLDKDAVKTPTVDARLTRKVKKVSDDEAGSAAGLSSNFVFNIYTSPSSPVPIIRNEELLLLRAEAKFFNGNVTGLGGAIDDLNLVRITSGGLAAFDVDMAMTEAQFVTALLYERRYSLMFEGHRWIDVRRFDRAMTDLPLDLPDHVRNLRYPIPLAECDARPGEPNCALGSQ